MITKRKARIEVKRTEEEAKPLDSKVYYYLSNVGYGYSQLTRYDVNLTMETEDGEETTKEGTLFLREVNSASIDHPPSHTSFEESGPLGVTSGMRKFGCRHYHEARYEIERRVRRFVLNLQERIRLDVSKIEGGVLESSQS